MTTVDEIKKHIIEQIEQENTWILVHDTVKQVLAEKWTGKKLNKRFADQVKEALTKTYGKEPIVYYEPGGGFDFCKLKVWSTPQWPTHNEMCQFYVAPGTPPSEPKYLGHWCGEVHPEGFDYSDCSHGPAAKERNARRELLLADSKTLHRICHAINKIRSNWETLQALVSEFETPAWEIRYHVEKLTGLKEDRNR